MPPQLSKSQSESGYDADPIPVPNTTSNNLKRKYDVGACTVEALGLEKFIRSVVKPLDLHLEDDVIFNLNSRGILFQWRDVFEIERIYTRCLGITERYYECHAYTHEPNRRLAYFILEEENKRCWSFLPDFRFHLLVFCHYNAEGAVTKVDVQYDQLTFFLHCLGVVELHKFFVAFFLTPIAKLWAKCFSATGLINPLTFLAHLVLVFWIMYQYFV